MNLAHLIVDVARRQPDRPAVTAGTVTRSYGEFVERSLRLASALRQRGVIKGDRVVLAMENCGEYLEALLGCWAAGAVAVPVNAKLHAREIALIAVDSGARAMFTTPGMPLSIEEAAADRGMVVICVGTGDYEKVLAIPAMAPVSREPDDDAWIFYTSGTTGMPKGAVLSHRNLLAMSQIYFADIDALSSCDTKFHTAPMSHGSGLYALPHLLKGSHQVVFPSFDIERIEAALRLYDRITMFAVPTTLTRLVAAWTGRDVPLERVKTIYYGGAPMYLADLRRALELFGPKLYQIFGQGEAPMTITGLDQALHRTDGSPESERLLASCGYPRTGVAVRIVDAEGRDLPPGEVGEVIARSDCVMKAYWNDPEASAKALRAGWLHTGDLGSLAADGLLSLTDRSKDLIISGGTNIYPREVEEALLCHSDVVEAAVIGAPDREWGEHVVAFVVRRREASIGPDDLERLCLERIARFKRPKRYLFVDALPKSSYGKILKTELRSLLSMEQAS